MKQMPSQLSHVSPLHLTIQIWIPASPDSSTSTLLIGLMFSSSMKSASFPVLILTICKTTNMINRNVHIILCTLSVVYNIKKSITLFLDVTKSSANVIILQRESAFSYIQHILYKATKKQQP